MTTIRTTADYLRLFGLAAALGVIGGLANELLHTVRGRNGNLRMPKYQRAHGLVYLGFFGPLILGGVAAVIVLVFLPLGSQPRTTASGQTVTDRTYDPLRVVPLALAAGVGGSAVLTAAQGRLLAMVNQQKAEFLEASLSGSLDRAAADAADKASKEVASRLKQLKPQVQQAVAQARAEVPAEFTQQLTTLGVSATDVDNARAAVAKGVIVFGSSTASGTAPSGGGAAPGPAIDLDQLFEQAAAEASEAVKATITERAATEKATILGAAHAFDTPADDAPPPAPAAPPAV